MILSVSYDISNDRLRKKLADYLIQMGMIRIQKSVFCGQMNKYESDIIRKKIIELYVISEEPTDQIMINVITKNSMKKSNFIGEISEDLLKELRGELRVKIY